MKLGLQILLFGLSLIFIVGCEPEADPLPIEKANGTISFGGGESDLKTAYKLIETNFDITSDSSGDFLHDSFQLLFLEQELRTDSSVTNFPGTAAVLISVFVPIGKGLQNGTYLAAKNRFCQADVSTQKVFCEMYAELDVNGDFMISEDLETAIVKEGMLKISTTESGETEIEFVGASETQQSIRFSYSGAIPTF